MLPRNGKSRGKPQVAGLLPLWGAFRRLGAHSPLPLCVINSGARLVNGREADSELPTWLVSWAEVPHSS